MNSKQDSRPRSQIGFLTFPAELRNRIYHLSLVRGIFCLRSFRGRLWSSIIYDVYEPAEISVALLQANRQILAEAGPILYGANKFIFLENEQRWTDLERWLEQIGTRNCWKIRELGTFPLSSDSTKPRRNTIIRCGEFLGSAIDLKWLLENPKFMIYRGGAGKILCLGIVWKNSSSKQTPIKNKLGNAAVKEGSGKRQKWV